MHASFESAVQARGASDLRVHSDEGQIAVSLLVDADSELEALVSGSDITLAALASFAAVSWVSSGVTHWAPTSTTGRKRCLCAARCAGVWPVAVEEIRPHCSTVPVERCSVDNSLSTLGR